MGQGYFTIVKITDFGPYVTKLILPMPEAVKEVTADSFVVYVERMDDKGEILHLPKSWMDWVDTELSKGYCKIHQAYPSSKTGDKQEMGSYVTLELAYGPANKLTAEISAVNGFNVYINSVYTITQTKDLQGTEGKITGRFFDKKLGTTCKDADGFINTESKEVKMPLRYGYFIPQTKGEKKPLLIWLHGAGEGGFDTRIAYTGNKVTNLAKDWIQKKFGGAYVIAPQCPTMWMDDGSGKYTRGGKSIYVQGVKAVIDEFIENNPSVDINRIYIGGDSNGGFMTMRMILDYPDFFAAAFPVCEALYDDTISDEQIQKLAHIPIWFTHVKNDSVVNPKETVIPTVERLKAVGAVNVHFSFWDKVVDIHEGFFDESGKPYEYIEHFAWIPMLNDDCDFDTGCSIPGSQDYDVKSPVIVDGKKVTLLDWLAMQKRA